MFVIGGGGSGTALYRRLQRRGIPFAAGILPENDVELPTARALAVETVTERAYQPIGEDAYARAQALVRQCGNAVCCLDLIGPVNEKNRVLLRLGTAGGAAAEQIRVGKYYMMIA